MLIMCVNNAVSTWINGLDNYYCEFQSSDLLRVYSRDTSPYIIVLLRFLNDGVQVCDVKSGFVYWSSPTFLSDLKAIIDGQFAEFYA